MLQRTCKSIAMLDAILSPAWEYRYYSYNSQWGPREQMASMRDGSGDSYFILFNQHGAALKGYAHESPAARWAIDHDQPLPGMFDGIPEEFAALLTEPAFSIQETTFSVWRSYGDSSWGCGRPRYPTGTDPGGAIGLLTVLQQGPDSYIRWASDYYEVPVDASAARRVYGHEPLTEELVRALNPQVGLASLAADVTEIGYGI